MAQLAKTSLKFPAFVAATTGFKAQDDAFAALQAASNALTGDTVVGTLLSFPYADGFAYYVVTKDSPLTLTHVPYGDAWQVPYAMIRGTRRADVLAQRQYTQRLAALFAH